MTDTERAKLTSDKLRACRDRVHDDAFEAQIALQMVEPLLGNTLKLLEVRYLYDSALFLRRALVRYLALALYRLLDKPNGAGRTGITASVPSLLEMAKSEGFLSEAQFQKLAAEFDSIKARGADGEYDLVQALRDLRNIQVAHSLIPWIDPTDQLWAHHLAEFAEAIFDFVVRLESILADSTGVGLSDLRKNAGEFGSSAGQFWKLLTSLR
jgi:AbiU2